MEQSRMLLLGKKFSEAVEETKTLYEISETEMPHLVEIYLECASKGLSPKLIARLLKASAHFVETIDDISDKFFKELK